MNGAISFFNNSNSNINTNSTHRRPFLDDSSISLKSTRNQFPSANANGNNNCGPDGLFPNNNAQSVTTNIWGKDDNNPLGKYDLNTGKSNNVWPNANSFFPTDNIMTGSSITSSTTSNNPVSLASNSMSYKMNPQESLKNMTSDNISGNNVASSIDDFNNNTSMAIRTNSTTTPLFTPFDPMNSNVSNSISSYLDINTSTEPVSLRQGNTITYGSHSNNETPLTTPILSSNMHSRFFPSPTSERIRYNYNTTNNTPLINNGNNLGSFNISEPITHLNLASSLNTPSEHKNSIPENFFFDSSFSNSLKRGNGMVNSSNTMSGSINQSIFNGGSNLNNNPKPSSSILDTLKNKSVDSFEMSFRNNENMLPNFVHEELEGDDSFLNPRGNIFNDSTNLNTNNQINSQHLQPSNLPLKPFGISSSNGRLENEININNNYNVYQNDYYSASSSPITERMKSNFFQNSFIPMDDQHHKTQEIIPNSRFKDQNKNLDILITHSNNIESQIENIDRQRREVLKKNNDDENDILVSLTGFNLNGEDRQPKAEKISSQPDILFNTTTENDTIYPEGFSSTFYKRAKNNFMFVREIQAKSTIIKFRSSSLIEFRVSLPTIPLFEKEETFANEPTVYTSVPTSDSKSPDTSTMVTPTNEPPDNNNSNKKKKYKSYAVQINLNELEGKIGGLRVSKQQALQQSQKEGSSQSPSSSSGFNKKPNGKRGLSYKKRSSNTYYYKKGYSNNISPIKQKAS
ncbi:hypothetical protein DASC09_038250 [Saccharomycopsis crataegensis]|uniref:NDT80 domain-containing protein n=1 Tax=Saccharomycopsis crataegensis TaxID=43959 RepID=A0AAV5QQB4_9ASCO|nr:hypothetical protein DASC09_038250 [Saccharomycopsis crataegensis]